MMQRAENERQIWETAPAECSLEQMARSLAENRLRVISFFDQVRVLAIEEPELRAVDPQLRAFTNVNTPEELASALSAP